MKSPANSFRVSLAFASVLPLSMAVSQPVTLPPAPTGVQTFNREGIQFSRVQAASVAPFVPANGTLNRPIGGGNWDFGIARTELTQGAWVEFVNSFNAVPIPEGRPWSEGMLWVMRGDAMGPGAYFTQVGPQGRGIWQTTAEGAVRPVERLGWFGAALYCNWLQNGRQASFDAIITGAYDLRSADSLDASTWPAITRAPNATFWIPTYDEWAVACFYDVSRYGPGSAGWWSHLNRRERPGIPGAPGEGETSAGWIAPNFEAELLPIASYPGSQSPWGLLDTSGSRSEWLEDNYGWDTYDRLYAGSRAGEFSADLLESIGWAGADSAGGGGRPGFRIATSTVPGLPTTSLVALLLYCGCQRRRIS